MIFTLLFSQPVLFFAYIIALVSSLTIHEFAHALVGSLRGDKTAQYMGRLTLNPLAHLDLLGTLMLLFAGFGWAKPVPFNPRNLQRPLADGVIIALSGPAANLLFATAASMVFRFGLERGWLMQAGFLPEFLFIIIIVNFQLLFFNLLPIPPLDGSHVLDALLYKTAMHRARMFLELYGPQVLLLLVLLASFTSWNPLGFIAEYSGLACSALTGFKCF
jgi:Zn-dependent protease